jgi:hypothetical protein
MSRIKHGQRYTPEYGIWRSMKCRCENPNDKKYYLYGGRGVSVAPSWRNDFTAFIRDIGPRPSRKHSIDRIDTNGNYEPGNVRWATITQQNRNARSVRRIFYHGKEIPIPDALELAGAGIARGTFRARIKYGWDLIEAIETPPLWKRSRAAE